MMFRILLAAIAAATPALAEPPAIEHVAASHSGGTWRFDVTLSHPDTGWEHYADAWRVLDMDGNELGIRVLLHPHETEQPFTRSLGGIAIPRDVKSVQIESRCLVDGWASERKTVELR